MNLTSYINIMRSNYYGTNKEIGCNICGRRSSIIGLVHGDMNNKMGVLLQLPPDVYKHDLSMFCRVEGLFFMMQQWTTLYLVLVSASCSRHCACFLTFSSYLRTL